MGEGPAGGTNHGEREERGAETASQRGVEGVDRGDGVWRGGAPYPAVEGSGGTNP